MPRGQAKNESGASKSKANSPSKNLNPAVQRALKDKTNVSRADRPASLSSHTTTSREGLPKRKLDLASTNGIGNAVSKKRKADDSDQVDLGRKAKQAKVKTPIGLMNYERACFANVTLQCLFGIPELSERYQEYSSWTLPDLTSFIRERPWMQQPVKKNVNIENVREKIRQKFKQNEENM